MSKSCQLPPPEDEILSSLALRKLRLTGASRLQCNPSRHRAHLRQLLAEPEAHTGYVSRSALLRQHSLYYFERLLSAPEGTITAFRQEAPVSLRHLEGSRGDQYFCVACWEHDLLRYRFSIWRRTHQVPGLLLCAEHDIPLHRVPRTPARGLMPHETQAFAQIVMDSRAAVQLKQSPVYRRYSSLAMICLRRHLPLRSSSFREAFMDLQPLRSKIQRRHRLWTVMLRRVQELAPAIWLDAIEQDANGHRTSLETRIRSGFALNRLDIVSALMLAAASDFDEETQSNLLDANWHRTGQLRAIQKKAYDGLLEETLGCVMQPEP